jgi:hypothetical protein
MGPPLEAALEAGGVEEGLRQLDRLAAGTAALGGRMIIGVDDAPRSAA